MSSDEEDDGQFRRQLTQKKSSLSMSSPKARSFRTARRSNGGKAGGFVSSSDEESEEDVLDLMAFDDDKAAAGAKQKSAKGSPQKTRSNKSRSKPQSEQADDSDDSVDSVEMGEGEKMGGKRGKKSLGWGGNNPESDEEELKTKSKSPKGRRARSPRKSSPRRRALMDDSDSDGDTRSRASKSRSSSKKAPRRSIKEDSSGDEKITTRKSRNSPTKPKRGSRRRGLQESDEESSDDDVISTRARARGRSRESNAERRFDGRRREGRARAVRADLRQTTDGTKLTPKASAKSLSKADVESRLGSDSDGNDGPSPRETKESSGGSKEESKTQESASEDEEDEETADLGETLNLSSADMLEFLTSPTARKPGYGAVQCYIERKKTGMGGANSEYYLFLKHDRRFLLAAKKKSGNKTSNYSISRFKEKVSDKGAGYLGKVRSNFVGTEFMVYDDGENPEHYRGGDEEQIRKELGAITYASNVLGSRGPRKMRVCVPMIDEKTKHPIVFRPASKTESLLTKAREGDDRCFFLINKPPRWNETVRAYVLNFNGRVTHASVKNFQLVHPDDHDRVILQFGRVGTHKFTMDYQYPLSPFQAFAICLSSFDYKLACE